MFGFSVFVWSQKKKHTQQIESGLGGCFFCSGSMGLVVLKCACLMKIPYTPEVYYIAGVIRLPTLWESNVTNVWRF